MDNKTVDKKKLQTIKGFRDYYPEGMVFQQWLYEKIKKVSLSFGFQEYDGPIIEPISLYAAKSGEELVKKQSYTLTSKTGEILTLRPEMTPTLARMVAQKENELTFPVKWFTYGPRFRYENPQRGRGREFYQWDIDILGTDSVLSDAEIISIAASFYKEIGLNSGEVVIKVNDRKYIQDNLSQLGIPKEKLQNVIKIIDKKSKINTKDFEEMLIELGISNIKIKSIYQLLNDRAGYKKSKWLVNLFDYIKKMGFEKYVIFDPTIVRGLDYYTRTVFEGWDVKGKFRSIWGGGRYDNLTSDVGSNKKIPGVGFAMGNMVIEEILKDNNKYPILSTNTSQILVTVFSPELSSKSIEIVRILREKGTNTELYPDTKTKLEKQLKYADKKGIPYVVIFGPEEIKKGVFNLKNMKAKSQEALGIDSMVDKITKEKPQ